MPRISPRGMAGTLTFRHSGHGGDDEASVLDGRFEVGLGRVVVQRQPHGRDAVEAALDSRTHSTGVHDIDGGIGAVVDARQHQIDLALLQEVVERHLHAVDRCPREGVYLHIVGRFDLPQEQRCRYGYGLTHTALHAVGGNGYHVSETARHLDSRAETLRHVPVVVGQKYQSFVLHHSIRFNECEYTKNRRN